MSNALKKDVLPATDEYLPMVKADKRARNGYKGDGKVGKGDFLVEASTFESSPVLEFLLVNVDMMLDKIPVDIKDEIKPMTVNATIGIKF